MRNNIPELPCTSIRLQWQLALSLSIRALGFFTVLMTVGCASQLGSHQVAAPGERLTIDDSYISGDGGQETKQNLGAETVPEDPLGQEAGYQLKEIKLLESMVNPNDTRQANLDSSPALSQEASVAVSAEGMPFPDFLHYIFGEILGVNYVLDPAVAGASGSGEPVTLSLKGKLSQRRLFELSVELMAQRDIEVNYRDGIYFIGPVSVSPSSNRVALAVGKAPSDVPNTRNPILQMVPLEFGIRIHISQLLTELVNAKVTPNFQTNTIMVEGERSEVLRALDIIHMLDVPSAKGRYIGLIELVFTDPMVISLEVKTLLESEGMGVAVNGGNENRGISLLPLASLGGVAVFASSQVQLERTNYWFSLLDVPSSGAELGFYIFTPKNARAADLGDSISQLIALGPTGKVTQGRGQQQTTGSAPSSERFGGAADDEIRMVVDEKSNSLIFQTSASRYNGLLRLLQQLDLMPKQIMLDILVAEVTLKDEFKHGVEWALQRGEVSLTTAGAFGATGIGGIGMIIQGTEGPLNANLLATNSLVNVISNPTMMVLDGESASINVGTSISISGETTQDPISGQRQTTASKYRDTGLSVNISPEITAGRLVKLKVDQSISNATAGSIGSGGNPDIFTRDLSTVVVARSGESILLAGLISESSSDGGSGAPGLSKIPLLGNLFKARARSRDRTELVMVVTAKIMTSEADWISVKDVFSRRLRSLGFSPSEGR